MPTSASRAVAFAAGGLLATGLLVQPALATQGDAPTGQHAVAPHVRKNQPKPPHRVELTWSPTYMANNNDYTLDEALQMTRRFDLIAAVPRSFQDYVSSMKAIKPDLPILAYTNATFVTPAQAKSLPASDFAKDSHGNKIKGTYFDTFLMDPAQASWRKQATKTCEEWSTNANYDGCLVDLLTMGVFSKGFVSSMPVNRKTGKDYTETQWRAQLIRLAHQYAADDPDKIIIGNAASNEYRFWVDPVSSQPIVKALPGAQMEDFLRGSSTPTNVYPGVNAWLKDIRAVRVMQTHGRTGLFSTKVWLKASHRAVATWERYAMASFLLAANGHSYFAFSDARTKQAQMGNDLPFSMPKKSLGAPRTGMVRKGQIYVRRFSHGLVVVNPGSSTVHLNLHGRYKTLGGQHRRRSTLGPHAGNVFVKLH